jgi:hypothetical protein
MGYRAAGTDTGATNPQVSYDPNSHYSYNGTTWVKNGGGPAPASGFGAGSLGSNIAGAAAAATRTATNGRSPFSTTFTPGAGAGWKAAPTTPPTPTVAQPSSAMGAPAMAPPPTASPSGTESGPGILEQWFNSRANGTDPGYEYATKRGLTDINNQQSAMGSFNSGATGQRQDDFLANMGAQREGQLDSLAGGASGEHQGKVNSMFSQGLGIAGGQAGLASGYDLGAGSAMSKANEAALMLALNKAGVDGKAAQSFINMIFGGAALAA